MIGQETLKNQFLNMIEIDTVPRFLILEGAKGSGKFTFCKWLANKMRAFLVTPELSVESVREVVRNCYIASGETLYVFRDADKMSAAAKNALLKVTEEPPRQAHFVMTVTNAENALETLKSRATVISMWPYPLEQREKHLDSYLKKNGVNLDNGERETILMASENLGQIERLVRMDVKELYFFCSQVADNIQSVTGVNAFKICQRLKIKEDGDEYDIDLFFLMLRRVLIEHVLDNPQDMDSVKKYCNMILVSSKYERETTLTGVKKDATLDMWVLAMRDV